VSPTRRTQLLALILVVLLGVDVAIRRTAAVANADLPTLPAIEDDAVTRLSLTTGDVEVVLERTEGTPWRMTGPIEARADQAAVRSVYGALLRDGVSMDLRVDTGNLEQYGLEQGAVRVDIESDAGPLASFYVGRDATGGATFVRLPDSEEVYQARIGGRHRFARTPGQWRDHMVLRIHPDQLQVIRLDPAAGVPFVATRSTDADGKPGTWSAPDIDLDQDLATELAQLLGGLRAGAIVGTDFPAGLDSPMATVHLTMFDGSELELSVGRTAEGTFVRRSDDPLIYRIAPGVMATVVRPAATWQNRQILNLNRADIHRLTLIESVGGSTVLEQDPATSQWSITRPANVDADQRAAMFAGRTLAQLRVESMAAITPEQAGFPSKDRIEIELNDKTHIAIELGRLVPGRPRGREALFIRSSTSPDRIGVLPLKVGMAMRKAWAR
jgi:hypothetical protein